MRRYIIYIMVAMLAAGGCCRNLHPEKAFLESETLMLESNGNTVFSYAPLNCQIGFNAQKKQFRVHNDNMSEYYVLTCSAMPVEEGQKLKASLKWAASSSITSHNNLDFTVSKVDDSGKIWLWCRTKKIAVSVMAL